MDLKKVILEVLEESHLHIPREVYQDMMDYYIEMYKKFKKTGSSRVTPKQYPPKTFHPDFSKVGKTFEFIKNLPQQPEITLTFTANNSHQYCRFGKGYNSQIQVSLDDAERVYTEVMEHELLHSLQHILKRHEHDRRQQVHPKDVRLKKGEKTFISRDPLSVTRARLPDVEYAGVPKKKFINQYYDWHGYPKDKYAQRRTTHENRPIEYYPDLMSATRSMQRSWIKFAASHAMDEKAVKSEEKKKNFYMLFFNNIKNNQPYPDYVKAFIPSLADKIFERFKKSGKEFLNMMLNKLYDAFVNKDFPFDYSKFKEIQKQAYEEKIQAEKEKSVKAGAKGENFTFDSRSLKLDYYDRGEILSDIQNEEAKDYLDGSYSDNAEMIFDRLGISSKEDKRGNEYVLFPSKLPNVIKLFKKIKEAKKYKFDKISEEASDAIWYGVLKYFYMRYDHALTTEAIQDLERRWYTLSGTENLEERKKSKEIYNNQVQEYKDRFKELIKSL
jgi:hypothetical protein